MSIVGYDDSRIARLSYLNLTSIRQDAAEMAELAVRAVVKRLDEGRTTSKDLVLQPAAAVCGSAGAPAGSATGPL